MRCDEVRELAAELALGIADCEARGEALSHLTGCSECRRLVQDLTGAADALMLLAPAHDPEPGFGARVLERVGLDARSSNAARRRRRRPPLWLPGVAAALLAAAAATAVALVLAFQGDRQLASYYRAILARAHGAYFQTAAIETRTGRPAGELFAYQGTPSWFFITMSERYRAIAFRCQLITRAGRTIPVPGQWTQAGWGAAIAIPIRNVAEVRLLGVGRTLQLNGVLPKPPAQT